MASPSAPTCVVMATRSRAFKKRATSRVVLLVVRVVICLYLPQGALYPVYLLHHGVWLEAEPWRPPQAGLRPHRCLHTSGRALQSLLRLFDVLAREDAVEDGRRRQIRAHPDAGYGHQPADPGVREGRYLLAHDLLELRLDLARPAAHAAPLIKALRTPRATR